MIYTAPITCGSGRELGPGILELFGPQMALTYRLDVHRAQKILEFQGPTSSHFPS